VLEEGPQANKGPFGKGGALEWVATASDAVAAVTLAGLHAFDDKAVQDSSKNLQVLWSRALLAQDGQLQDDVAFNLLPESTRWVVKSGVFDGVINWLEWVKARTDWLDVGTEAFLSSPACADGAECQVVIFGAGFDTRSIRYQREGLRFFEVDLPDTIEAKSVVHQRYKSNNPETRLPTLIGMDLNDCEQSSLLDKLEAEHGFKRNVPTMFVSEAVLFYVNPQAIANLYNEIFTFGQQAEAMYCFTDSMRPFVLGPFSDEIRRFFDAQGISILGHTSRWGGAVQFCHAVARTPEAAVGVAPTLLNHVSDLIEAPVTSYAPERSFKPEELAKQPSFNNSWYAVIYSSALTESAPTYSTCLFGEMLTVTRAADGSVTCVPAHTGGVEVAPYAARDHQGLIFVWRGDAAAADDRMLPTHPEPEATHAVETILDYGVDWTYIVENNLDTPHLYWLHDGSIPPIESLGCSRKNIESIGLRFFRDDVGFGHIGKTSKKVTKIVRYDSPNIVRHGGVSGFSEEFNIVPIAPHRTRVLLRQRFPKGPILSTLLKVPGTAALLQYLVRNWNYQIALEDYSVMQGQAHNIDDFGAPNWRGLSNGDDLIVKFWQWKRRANRRDGIEREYFTRWDGSSVKAEDQRMATAAGQEAREDLAYIKESYVSTAPAAEYPPIHYKVYEEQQAIFDIPDKIRAFEPKERLAAFAPEVGAATVAGFTSAFIAAAAGALS